MKVKRFILLVFVLLCTILALSLLIPVEYLPGDTRNDKIHHILVFILVTLGARLCLPMPILPTIIAVIAFAALAELSQFLVTYRSANWQDMQANLIGISIASLLIISYEVIKKWKRAKPSDR